MDSTGCIVSDDIMITVKEERSVFIPNAFSPDNDGVNDIFTIFTGERVSGIKQFKVFDRWGNLIYEISPMPGQ